MASVSSIWWPQSRIQATLCPEYISSHLPPSLRPQLGALLPWGEGLTSETYLDWILAKAGRLFLTVLDIGIPERIFAIVDDSFDDSDLPIAAHSVDRLPLCPDGEEDSQIESKFFLAQWRFLVRGISEGEHVRYSDNEGVPVELLRTGSSLSREGVEKVVLAGAVSRVYLRTTVTIGGAPHFFDEQEVLDEIRSLRRLSHAHLYSIYGSYSVDNTICILFAGFYERTLVSFLTDVPLSFKRLAKSSRRHTLITWPHCLASALSWLHAHRQIHGSIRPSNVLVDREFNVFLGQFEALDTLLPPAKVDDVESYQYGPPERWMRSTSVSVHDSGPGPQRLALPSGGRTARRPSSSSGPSAASKLSHGLDRLRKSHHAHVDHEAESVLSQSTAIRVGFPHSPSRLSFAHSSSSSSSGCSTKTISTNTSNSAHKRFLSLNHPTINYSPSITPTSHSASSCCSPTSPVYSNINNPGAHLAHLPSFSPSDIFSLGATTLDILTHLCQRPLSTFAHHRGAKNRTPGRGGSVADCSFHTDRNLAQVGSWITLLEHDAEKKCRPKVLENRGANANANAIFGAVGRMLGLVREMLAKDPVERPSAFYLEGRFADVLAGLDDSGGKEME